MRMCRKSPLGTNAKRWCVLRDRRMRKRTIQRKYCSAEYGEYNVDTVVADYEFAAFYLFMVLNFGPCKASDLVMGSILSMLSNPLKALIPMLFRCTISYCLSRCNARFRTLTIRLHSFSLKPPVLRHRVQFQKYIHLKFNQDSIAIIHSA